MFFIIIIGIEDFFPVGSQVSLRFGGRALYLYMNIIKKGGSGGILFAGGPSVFPMGDRLIAGIETGLSFMEGSPLPVGGDGIGASSSNPVPIDLNLPPAPEQEDPTAKLRAVEEVIHSLEMEQVREKKRVLAEMIGPLIEEEAKKYPSIRGTLPSAPEMVEKLISRIGSSAAKEANEPTAATRRLRHLKTWLTRACQNVEDSNRGRGNLNIRGAIREIIFDEFKNDP